MSIYDKSSLVLIPSGTKTGKVYSQKPVSGDGDFTFTRSSAATRVNADGNIEKETQNLLLQSNTFDTTWVNFNTSDTSGQSGYDGTNNAWLLSSTGANGYIRQTSISASGVQTFSIYAKAGSLSWLRVTSQSGNVKFNVNLSNGSIGTIGNLVIEAKATDVGNGWYRCSMAFNASTTGIYIYPATADDDASQTSGNILIQDAQLEQGLVARDVITTTTAAVEGGITDNVPRLDYTDSSCPSLLLEPQRTNDIPYSEWFGYSGWAKTRCTITDNYAISPEGFQNAALMTATGSDARLEEAITLSGDYTQSIWVKSGQSGDVAGQIDFAGIAAVTFTANQEWQRVETTNDSFHRVRLRITNSGDKLLIYGAQLEAGTYATSYIPTYGSSVTRVYENQDATGLNSNVFNNDNLTLFYDFNYNAEGREGSTTAYRIFSGSSQLGIKGRSGSSRSMEIYSSGDFSGSIVFNNIANASRIKVALRVTNGTCELFFNGAKDTETIDVSAAAPYSWGQVTMLASSSINTSLNQCLGFPTALTDQELIDLTTL